jgi:hypothetical protein
MCDIKKQDNKSTGIGTKIVPAAEAVGTVLSHDITEIRPGDFKGRAFKKGHVIKEEDISHLKRLGKENLYILEIQDDEMHENDAATKTMQPMPWQMHFQAPVLNRQESRMRERLTLLQNLTAY